MQLFDIRLAYRDRHWLTVRFELGCDEVGSTEEVETRLAQDILDLFAAIGLLEPKPLPVLAVEQSTGRGARGAWPWEWYHCAGASILGPGKRQRTSGY
jgi:hypothetical protein